MATQHSAEFVSVLEPHRQEIIDCVASGMSTADIASRFGVRASTVTRYIRHCQSTDPEVSFHAHDAWAARDAEITRLREAGMSMKDISRRLDVGYEAVRTVCSRAGTA